MPPDKPVSAVVIGQALRFFELRTLAGGASAAVKARTAVALVLTAYGWSSGRIAKRLDVDRSSVSNALKRGRSVLADGRDRELQAAVHRLLQFLPE